jgi:integrase
MGSLPPFVQRKHDGNLRYFRRPPLGIEGAPFNRAFATKDPRVMYPMNGKVHAEAGAYIARLMSGLTRTDEQIDETAQGVALSAWYLKTEHGGEYDLRDHIKARLPDMPGASPADVAAIYKRAVIHRAGYENRAIEQVEKHLSLRRGDLKKLSPQVVVPSGPMFTMRDAYDQAWLPAKTRAKNTIAEIGRYVDEFMALNGKVDLSSYTRHHWAAWHRDCLDRHKPGPTAFKRFSMMKTVVVASIRAGLTERKDFAGQDVAMNTPARHKLRNQGWMQDELTTWFSHDLFKGVRSGNHPEADYWIAVIIAYTGARLSEITGMTTKDVAIRHDYWTFYLAAESGKTEDSRRIIPIPKQVLDLGFLEYLKTVGGDLFEGVTAKMMSQAYSRCRSKLGINRKGCDMHAFRHHLKTLLDDVGASDRVSNYITGHAAPNEGGRYGETLYRTARQYLDLIDLGVTIPKWKPAS